MWIKCESEYVGADITVDVEDYGYFASKEFDVYCKFHLLTWLLCNINCLQTILQSLEFPTYLSTLALVLCLSPTPTLAMFPLQLTVRYIKYFVESYIALY